MRPYPQLMASRSGHAANCARAPRHAEDLRFRRAGHLSRHSCAVLEVARHFHAGVDAEVGGGASTTMAASRFATSRSPIGWLMCAIRRRGSPVLVVQIAMRPTRGRAQRRRDDRRARGFALQEGAALQRQGKSRTRSAGRDAGRSRAMAAGASRASQDRPGRAAINARLERSREGQAAHFARLVSPCPMSSARDKADQLAALLLDYLHNTGTVFYRQGLFGDASFLIRPGRSMRSTPCSTARKTFKKIERYGGRFRRSDLAEWAWQKHSVKDQELFLSFMQQCGICFIIARAARNRGRIHRARPVAAFR